MKKLGVYIHIPFCKSKCNYCDFKSFANKEEKFEKYINILLREIEECDTLYNAEIQTVFVGGGTPTVLPPALISMLLDKINGFNIAKNAEITVEANPGMLSKAYLRLLKGYAVNRISLGLQAWQAHHLERLGRIHSAEDFLRNYQDALEVGFDNINVDLMLALPGQSMPEVEELLYNVTKLKPQHISAYGLIVENDTVFGKLYQENRLQTVSDELDRQMYYYTRSFLAEKGYMQYEISNFAQKGFECKHNIKYWMRSDYLGFGLNAHSFINGVRYSNTDNLDEYLNYNMNRNYYNILQKEAMGEFIFLGLRMTEGISTDSFYKQFGTDIFHVFGEQIKKFINLELLEQNNNILALTKRGIDVSNLIFSEFI